MEGWVLGPHSRGVAHAGGWVGTESHSLVFFSVVPVHQLVQTESSREGTVTWKTYHTYIKASGGSV